MKIAEVAIDSPLSSLTYRVPIHNQIEIKRGVSVRVPLRSKTISGVVLDVQDQPQLQTEFELKDIESLDPNRLPLTEQDLSWAKWLSDYYHYPLGQTLAYFFPPASTSKSHRSAKKADPPETPSKVSHTLNPDQKSVFDSIQSTLGNFSTHLIWGVTGAGKTEVYLELFEANTKSGKQGLFLVPEISLTPQLTRRFEERFPGRVALLHSQLTPKKRREEWQRCLSADCDILIGPRSALFCPLPNLGLIVVDEEHEGSFKQEDHLRYHARDAAIKKAQILNIPIVLGSATPSAESYFQAQSGKYKLHTLNNRVDDRPLPDFQIVDLKLNKPRKIISDELKAAIQTELDKHKQVLLFLNRRGMGSQISCSECGEVRFCPDCDISLTLHYHSHLVCHYCNYQETLSETCPSCHQGKMQKLGIGTESVEAEIKALFPEARLARADRDEISNRQEMEDLIQSMESFEIDILIGTQMIAKGLDFKRLNLVGVILADLGFHQPDFRANERAFQIITQVGGRAGRHIATPGKVIVQTLLPQTPTLHHCVQNDYSGFMAWDLESRRELGYPPFGRLAILIIQSPDANLAESTAHNLSHLAQQAAHHSPKKTAEVLGPAPAGIYKLRRHYRQIILIKAKDWLDVQFVVKNTMERCKSSLPKKVQVLIDIDPQTTP